MDQLFHPTHGRNSWRARLRPPIGRYRLPCCVVACLLAAVGSWKKGRGSPQAYSPQRADAPVLRNASRAVQNNEILVEYKPGATAEDKERVHNLVVGGFRNAVSKLNNGKDILALDSITAPSVTEIHRAFDRTGDQVMMTFNEGAHGNLSHTDFMNRIQSISTDSLSEELAAIKKDPSVSSAQPNYYYQLSQVVNDDLYKQGLLWNLYGDQLPVRIGPVVSPFGTGVEKAWANHHTGSNDVYIAVLDTGVDSTHNDLLVNVDTQDAQDYIRDGTNPLEAGLVGKDEVGHGTHIAGIIGALGNNDIGIVGINWNVRVIPFKVAAGDGKVSSAAAIKAFDRILELKQQGKNIVAANLSWDAYAEMDANGKPILDLALLRRIKTAGAAGVLTVAAAKNDGTNNDVKPAYPASFDTRDTSDGTPALDFDSVISVAAIDSNGDLWSFSNFGPRSVHIAAPGVRIVSSVPANNYYFNIGYPVIPSSDTSTYVSLDGTSMAAPHVAGAVALYVASHPGTSAKEARDAILNSAKTVAALKGKVATGGRLDLSGF